MSPPAGPWVYFFSGRSAEEAQLKMDGLPGPACRYAVQEVIPVAGEIFSAAAEKTQLVRIEVSQPLPPAAAGKAGFRGMVRHLNYTDQAQRAELQRISAQELPPPLQSLAVLIPIRKTPAWWALAQDERQAHFAAASRENHASIGQRYAAKIHRRLYHASYFDDLPEYDFLTYFEFEEKDRMIFKSLLRELRDTAKNPEWHYVDRECEIWMTKVS